MKTNIIAATTYWKRACTAVVKKSARRQGCGRAGLHANRQRQAKRACVLVCCDACSWTAAAAAVARARHHTAAAAAIVAAAVARGGLCSAMLCCCCCSCCSWQALLHSPRFQMCVRYLVHSMPWYSTRLLPVSLQQQQGMHVRTDRAAAYEKTHLRPDGCPRHAWRACATLAQRTPNRRRNLASARHASSRFCCLPHLPVPSRLALRLFTRSLA